MMSMIHCHASLAQQLLVPGWDAAVLLQLPCPAAATTELRPSETFQEHRCMQQHSQWGPTACYVFCTSQCFGCIFRPCYIQGPQSGYQWSCMEGSFTLQSLCMRASFSWTLIAADDSSPALLGQVSQMSYLGFLITGGCDEGALLSPEWCPRAHCRSPTSSAHAGPSSRSTRFF